MEAQVAFLKLLADPTRLKLLKLLLEEELCVCELQVLMQVSQPAVSQHLAKLRAAGLVHERPAGMWTYYRADREQVNAGLESVADLLQRPPDQVSDMLPLVERRANLNRVELCKESTEEVQR